MRYRVGTSGGWTALAGTGFEGNEDSLTVGDITHFSISLPAAAENQPNVQVSWAFFQQPVIGLFTGFALDNISVTPGPTSLALLSVGAIGLLRRRRRASKTL